MADDVIDMHDFLGGRLVVFLDGILMLEIGKTTFWFTQSETNIGVDVDVKHGGKSVWLKLAASECPMCESTALMWPGPEE